MTQINEKTPLFDALRGLGLLQLEFIKLALFISSEGPAELEGEKLVCILSEPKRRVSTMLAMAASQSLNTVIRMAELRGIPVRDTYPVARSVVETFINAAYLLSESDEVAERAIKYIDFAAWKHHNRKVGSGNFSLDISSVPNAAKTSESRFPEFHGRGKGVWSSLDVPSRIRRVGELAGAHSGARLLAAYAVTYSLSSEVIHGSPFGVSYFYSGCNEVSGDVEAFREGTVRQLEDILVAVLHAACGYLAAFSKVQDLSALANAEEKLFSRLLEISSKDPSLFPQSSNPNIEEENDT